MAEARAGLEAGHRIVAEIDLGLIGDDELAGFEALIRWAHPQRGLLAPGAFWEALDDPVLGRLLSNAVLAQVAGQLAEWRRQGVGVACVAVNLSASQLRDPAFLDHLRELLDGHDLPAASLKVEITESVLLGRGAGNVLRTLKGIHEAGIETAMTKWIAVALEEGRDIPEPKSTTSHSGRLLHSLATVYAMTFLHRSLVERWVAQDPADEVGTGVGAERRRGPSGLGPPIQCRSGDRRSRSEYQEQNNAGLPTSHQRLLDGDFRVNARRDSADEISIQS
jgi:hypothetical protein